MTLARPLSLDANRILRTLAWVRVGLGALLVLLAPFVPPLWVPGPDAPLIALTLIIVVLSSAALLLLVPFRAPRRVGWLLCLLDSALITAVVAATGGPRSLYASLYVLTVIGASVLLPRAGALAIAASGSLLYTALVATLTALPASPFQPVPDATVLDMLTMFLNSGTLLVVAIVAGGLAERFRATREELETQRQDLRDLQAFKDVVLRSVGAGLVVLDRQHTVTVLNRAAEQMSGRPAAELIGQPWSTVFGPLPLTAIESTIAANPHASIRHELILGRPDGRRLPVRMTFSVLRADDGRHLGLIAVCEDLSEIREMEDRMRQADRLATLGRLAANIAHEIRNPLASLTGAIEALTSNVGARDERERLTQIVARESERLNQMIGTFLEYARPAPLVREPVDISELIEEVLVLLAHRDLPPGLKITRDLPPGLVWPVDAQRVRQALWNLCLNAIEAMPEGGELTVGASPEGNALTISVTDTGYGIAATELPHLFEPFFSTKSGGSGLGLALVHRIVRDHGGEIDVRTAPGRGTTFSLTLGGLRNA